MFVKSEKFENFKYEKNSKTSNTGHLKDIISGTLLVSLFKLCKVPEQSHLCIYN